MPPDEPPPHAFEFQAAHMYTLMKEEVDLAFGGACPWHASSFEFSFMANLMQRNFYVVDSVLAPCFSISEALAMRLAFATGTVPTSAQRARPASTCWIAHLDADMCELIYSFVFIRDTKDMPEVFCSIMQWLY